MKVNKSFPADRGLDIRTFLNDPKIDGELYAYLLGLSMGIDGQTVLMKKDLPNQSTIADFTSCKTRQTVAAHLNYLKTRGYIREEKDRYILLNPEKYYFNIPLETIQYLLATVKELVIKIYLYLGASNNINPGNYAFTLKELCEHLGVSYTSQNGRTKIKCGLDILEKLELINYVVLYDKKKMPYMKLTKFSLSCPIKEKTKNLC